MELEDLSTGELAPFIEDAHTIINNRVAGHVDTETATLMEKWLAAHLTSMREQRLDRAAIGDSDMWFEGETGEGLKATRYGQQVLALDDSGLLNTTGHYSATVHSGDDDTIV